MEEKICVSFVAPADFKIRSKQDARKFLEMVRPGAELMVDDVKDPTMFYYIRRVIPTDPLACIAHSRKKREWYEPDFMRSSEDAVDMVWTARKSINAKYFSNEK